MAHSANEIAAIISPRRSTNKSFRWVSTVDRKAGVYSPTMLPKLVTATGLSCVFVGVAWGFVDEATNFRFDFFTRHAGAFLLTLVIGIALSVVGTLSWAAHWDRRKRLEVAGSVVVIGFVGMVFPENVHDAGMLLVITIVCGWILSAVLVVMAMTVNGRQEVDSKRHDPS
ncbi:MAG TPA: hypothetical protein VMF66_18425 [Candidatus Acidoferrum sp.]|nr:hypothetical protein [Candidatus Acidoferrum sp.]